MLMEPVRAESRSFGGDVGDNSIDEGVDVHGPTTTVQGRCALATDTPPPRAVATCGARHPANRDPFLQAIKEQARTSRQATQLQIWG